MSCWRGSCPHEEKTSLDASLHPHDDEYDVEKKEEALQGYLKVQGIDRTDLEISYNQQGEPLIEYYVDDSIKQYCFILHLWGDYWEDYEKGISKYQDAILCSGFGFDIMCLSAIL